MTVIILHDDGRSFVVVDVLHVEHVNFTEKRDADGNLVRIDMTTRYRCAVHPLPPLDDEPDDDDGGGPVVRG